MFGISGEHLLILGIVLIIFGPRRLPELGHTLGKAIRNFKDSMTGIEEANYRKLDEKGSLSQKSADKPSANLSEPLAQASASGSSSESQASPTQTG